MSNEQAGESGAEVIKRCLQEVRDYLESEPFNRERTPSIGLLSKAVWVAESMESEIARLQKMRDEWEGQAIQLGSAYASASIALAGAGSFLREAKKKSLDRFHGCLYCGNHSTRDHARDCALIQFEKNLESTRPTPSASASREEGEA